jgi:release factor glutamine methyltransferase
MISLGTSHPSRLLVEAADRLKSAGVDTPAHDARLLLAHAVGTEPGRLALLDQRLSATVVAQFEQLVECRAARVPLQHLTGVAYFRQLELAVGPGVFVPRPETEVMVGWAIDQLRARGELRPRVVDLGTGSGAIAKSILVELPGSEVHAVEVSKAAATWAERNLGDSAVSLVVADMATALPELNGTVDLVIANPPYLAPDEPIAPEAGDHDPAVALFAADNGMAAIEVVINTASRLLRPGGLLCVEHSDSQGRSVPAMITHNGGFEDVQDHDDLTGRSRFATATRAG